ncbi:hypothetical protein PBI_DEWDROP_44 [Microbacterium phage Dewdrop]|nr:hypothetical protein PBI_LEAF_44 [Microbacterium phage Leaf]QGZ17413.1 hypothetical protein PBI_DEWDROP_44 [Microbacterium phage Dewdrop]
MNEVLVRPTSGEQYGIGDVLESRDKRDGGRRVVIVDVKVSQRALEAYKEQVERGPELSYGWSRERRIERRRQEFTRYTVKNVETGRKSTSHELQLRDKFRRVEYGELTAGA